MVFFGLMFGRYFLIRFFLKRRLSNTFSKSVFSAFALVGFYSIISAFFFSSLIGYAQTPSLDGKSSIIIEALAPPLEAKPRQRLRVGFKITNSGQQNRQVLLQPELPQSWRSLLGKRKVFIKAGASYQHNFQVMVPRQVPPERYSIGLIAQSCISPSTSEQNHPERCIPTQENKGEFQLPVAPKLGLAVTSLLTRDWLIAGESFDAQMMLANESNTSVTLTYQWQLSDDWLSQLDEAIMPKLSGELRLKQQERQPLTLALVTPNFSRRHTEHIQCRVTITPELVQSNSANKGFQSSASLEQTRELSVDVLPREAQSEWPYRNFPLMMSMRYQQHHNQGLTSPSTRISQTQFSLNGGDWLDDEGLHRMDIHWQPESKERIESSEGKTTRALGRRRYRVQYGYDKRFIASLGQTTSQGRLLNQSGIFGEGAAWQWSLDDNRWRYFGARVKPLDDHIRAQSFWSNSLLFSPHQRWQLGMTFHQQFADSKAIPISTSRTSNTSRTPSTSNTSSTSSTSSEISSENRWYETERNGLGLTSRWNPALGPAQLRWEQDWALQRQTRERLTDYSSSALLSNETVYQPERPNQHQQWGWGTRQRLQATWQQGKHNWQATFLGEYHGNGYHRSSWLTQSRLPEASDPFSTTKNGSLKRVESSVQHHWQGWRSQWQHSESLLVQSPWTLTTGAFSQHQLSDHVSLNRTLGAWNIRGHWQKRCNQTDPLQENCQLQWGMNSHWQGNAWSSARLSWNGQWTSSQTKEHHQRTGLTELPNQRVFNQRWQSRWNLSDDWQFQFAYDIRHQWQAGSGRREQQGLNSELIWRNENGRQDRWRWQKTDSAQEQQPTTARSQSRWMWQRRWSSGRQLEISWQQLHGVSVKDQQWQMHLRLPLSVPVWKRRDIVPITGRIVDEASGQGVSDVAILLGNLIAISNAKGEFRFPSVTLGRHDLSLRTQDKHFKNRMVRQTLPMAVDASRGSEMAPIQLSLAPALSASGQVILHRASDFQRNVSEVTHEPLPYVRVWFSQGERQLSTLTNSSGEFEMTGLMPGTWQLQVETGDLPPEYRFEQRIQTIELSDHLEHIDFVAKKIRRRVRFRKVRKHNSTD